jgi:hypothetical protein
MIWINRSVYFLLVIFFLFTYVSSASEVIVENQLSANSNNEFDQRFEQVKEYFYSTEQSNKLLFDSKRYSEIISVYDLRNTYNQDPYIDANYTATLNEVVGLYYSQLASTEGYENVQIRLVFDMYLTEDTITRANQISYTKDYCKGYIKRLLNSSSVGKEFIVVYFGTVVTKLNKQYSIVLPVISAALQNKLSTAKKQVFASLANALAEKANQHSQERELLLADASQLEEFSETSLRYNSSDVTDAFTGIEETLGITNTANEIVYTYSLIYKGVLFKKETVLKSLGNKYTFVINAQKQYSIDGVAPVFKRYFEFFTYSSTSASIRDQFDNLAILISAQFLKKYATSVVYPVFDGASILSSVYTNSIYDFRAIHRQPVSNRVYNLPTIDFLPTSSSTLNSGQCILVPYQLINKTECFALNQTSPELCGSCAFDVYAQANSCYILSGSQQKSIDEIVYLINQLMLGQIPYNSISGKRRGDINNYLLQISDVQFMTCVTVEQRIYIIKYFKEKVWALNSLNDQEQTILVKLVQCFSDNRTDKQLFLTKLKTEKLIEFLFDDLALSHNSLTGQYLLDFVSLLELNFIRVCNPQVTTAAVGKIFYFNPALFNTEDLVRFSPVAITDITSDGLVEFGTRTQITWQINSTTYSPYESFTLKFINQDFKLFNNQTYVKDKYYTSSSLYIFTLLKFAIRDRVALANNLLLNVALVSSGVGNIGTAATWSGRILAGVDLTVGAVGIVMDAGFKQQLVDAGYGDAVLYYDMVSIGWTVASLTPVIIAGARKALVAIRRAKNDVNFASRTQELTQLETDAEHAIAEYEANLARVQGAGRFIARSGNELKTYLNGLVNKPLGKSYSGEMFRYIPEQYSDAKLIVQTSTSDATNRFRTGLYLSETKTGNVIEASSYGGTSGKQLYEFTDVQVNNLLDLTDANTVEILGTTFDQMKLTGVAKPYEFTQEVAIWAKNNGYSGVKFYGSQGGNTVYTNFILFEQQTVNSAIKGSINSILW